MSWGRLAEEVVDAVTRGVLWAFLFVSWATCIRAVGWETGVALICFFSFPPAALGYIYGLRALEKKLKRKRDDR